MEKKKIIDKEFELYIPYKEIEEKIIEVASQINEDLKGQDPLFLGILNGSFMFASELMKNVNLDCRISFLKLASYTGTKTSGSIKQLIGLNEEISNRVVVIIEDIVDTGITLENIIKQLGAFEPKKILIATLLHKPNAYQKDYPLDYCCFEIPDDFIIGFGLDYNGYGRNFKNIYKICK